MARPFAPDTWVEAPRDQEPGTRSPRADQQRDIGDRWILALASRDDHEVNFVVRRSRAERVTGSAPADRSFHSEPTPMFRRYVFRVEDQTR